MQFLEFITDAVFILQMQGLIWLSTIKQAKFAGVVDLVEVIYEQDSW